MNRLFDIATMVAIAIFLTLGIFAIIPSRADPISYNLNARLLSLERENRELKTKFELHSYRLLELEARVSPR